MRNETNQAIRNSEIEHYKGLIKEHGDNCQAMWKTLGHIIGNKRKKNTQINSLKIDNNKLTSQMEISNGLNHFLCNVAKGLAKPFEKNNEDEFLKYLDHPVHDSIEVTEISTEEVRNQVKQLYDKKICWT